MLGLKLNHVSKRGHWFSMFQINMVNWTWKVVTLKKFLSLAALEDRGSCYFDNFWCNLSWKFHQNDDIFVLVKVSETAWNSCHEDVNTLRPRQNGCHFPDDIYKCIFLNENIWFKFKVSLEFAPKGPINNISALVQIMAWRRPGDKPLSESMMV